MVAGSPGTPGAPGVAEVPPVVSVESSPWLHFFTETKDTYECKLVPSGTSLQPHAKSISNRSGPSNLRRHISGSHHKAEFDRFNELLAAPTLMDPAAAAALVLQEQQEKINKGGIAAAFRSAKRHAGASGGVTEALVRELAFVCYMIKNGLSFISIEDPNLAHFVGLSGQKALPSRRRVSDTLLPLMYEIVVEMRNETVKGIDFFSITVDGWTSDANDQYLAVTVHAILTQSWCRE